MTVSVIKLHLVLVLWECALGYYAKLHLGLLNWGALLVLCKEVPLGCFPFNFLRVLHEAPLGALQSSSLGVLPWEDSLWVLLCKYPLLVLHKAA